MLEIKTRQLHRQNQKLTRMKVELTVKKEEMTWGSQVVLKGKMNSKVIS